MTLVYTWCNTKLYCSSILPVLIYNPVWWGLSWVHASISLVSDIMRGLGWRWSGLNAVTLPPQTWWRPSWWESWTFWTKRTDCRSPATSTSLWLFMANTRSTSGWRWDPMHSLPCPCDVSPPPRHCPRSSPRHLAAPPSCRLCRFFLLLHSAIIPHCILSSIVSPGRNVTALGFCHHLSFFFFPFYISWMAQQRSTHLRLPPLLPHPCHDGYCSPPCLRLCEHEIPLELRPWHHFRIRVAAEKSYRSNKGRHSGCQTFLASANLHLMLLSGPRSSIW